MTALSYVTTANLKVRLGLGTAVTDDDGLFDDVCDEVNDWIESYTWRPVGPNAGGTLTFDSYEDTSDDGYCLYVRQGVRSVTSMTVATSTGATPGTVDTDDIVILPRVQNRKPGFPGTEIRFKDYITGPVNLFGRGYGDIVVVGDFGFEAIPPAVVEIAEVLAVRTWHARQAGQADVVGSDADGEPTVSRYVSGKDRLTLKAYRPAGGLVAG